MPADVPNLINLIKLHVNGKMVEGEVEERKKKEQESSEAIRGLKMKHLNKQQ